MDEVARGPRLVVLDARSALPDFGHGWAWVYFGDDAARFFALRRSLEGRAREIAAGPLINDAVDEFRDELLNFDAAIEPRSELRWQATVLAERNVFTSGFLYACVSALALDRVLRSTEDDLLVLVDDALLGRRLADVGRRYGRDVRSSRRAVATARARLLARGTAHRLLFVGRSAWTRRVVRRRLDPARPLPELDVLLATWADPQTFPVGAPVENETYFGTLPADLRAEGKTVGFLANLATWAHPLERIVDGLGNAVDPVVVPEEALRVGDTLAIALRTVLPPARVRGRFAPGSLDLTRIVEDWLAREWAEPRQLWALQFFHLGRHLAARGRPAEVIFPFENQTWEKTLRLGLHDALPDTEVVGFQHTPISERWFPYFPSRRDIADGQLPDRLLTIGRRWRRLFAESGYPEGMLEIVPPLRHPHLSRGVDRRARGAGEQPVVLVAGSIGLNDSLELVVKALQALEPISGVRIRIKLHPKLGCSQEDFERSVLGALGRDALANTVTFVGGRVYDVLQDTDLVLYNTTSVAYEALALGIPVVFVESDFWFDIDPLPPGSDAREAARTPAEIRAAIERLLRETPAEAERRRLRAQALIGDAFA